MLKHHIILGSRGSILALAQTNWVKKQLQRHYPQLTFSIQVIETQGDKDLTSHFGNSELSLKSFFTKEIEKSLLDGEIDIAVHSMKDVPSSSPVGLICGAIPVREDVRDVLVSTSGKTLAELPKGAILGTSSLRRIQNIKQLRPDLEIKALRGNIHTRLKKLEEGHYDAIVLAAAGLKRVGLEEKITEYLNPTVFSPAPAQGALYIQCREKDEETRNILQSIHDENLAKILEIEREFSRIFDGGCHTPMGCYSKVEGKNILFHAMYSHKEKSYQTIITENITKGKEIAIMAAQEIQKMMKQK
ncbi:Porphobilinogen deaminase [Fusobacterium necrophorum subsp. funduliforme]|uniref:hydroxymethylbilane synthase n=1 Tax=Fusobacterium necrophorum TaxID=859 RepID=UPI001B8B9C4A|nr:hydroxymethylbilane synthase [Fusobacterium necrophorum]MBR8723489.1 Porphobilinogen deaminase [Fusobacterium necrophorum subsp. funduliforme]